MIVTGLLEAALPELEQELELEHLDQEEAFIHVSAVRLYEDVSRCTDDILLLESCLLREQTCASPNS